MLELILIRHGETALNRHGRYQGGGSDAPLTETGEAQARALASHLSGLVDPGISLWSSDRQRAWRTAALALPDGEARRDPRLRELDFGEFDGLAYEENLDRHGERFSRWLLDPWKVAPPGGETLHQLRDRVEAWLREASGVAERTLAVAHGGSIQMVLALALELPFERTWRLSLPPATLLRVRPRPGGTLTGGSIERLDPGTGSYTQVDLGPEAADEP